MMTQPLTLTLTFSANPGSVWPEKMSARPPLIHIYKKEIIIMIKLEPVMSMACFKWIEIMIMP